MGECTRNNRKQSHAEMDNKMRGRNYGKGWARDTNDNTPTSGSEQEKHKQQPQNTETVNL